MTAADGTRPAGRWWVPLRLPGPTWPAPRARLLVLPHSGAGPNQYRPLLTHLATDVEVLGLNLPGRERRAAEAPDASLAQVLDSLTAVGPALPTAVLGNSLGALLAPHVADRIGALCTGIVVSGQTPAERGRWPVRSATDQDLLGVVERGGVTLPQVLSDEGWRRRLLANLRADFRLAAQAVEGLDEVYLTAPVTAVVGREDPFVDLTEVARWGRYTSGDCVTVTIPGGHFAILEPRNREVAQHHLSQALLGPPAPQRPASASGVPAPAHRERAAT